MSEPLTLIALLRAKAGAEDELGRRLAALIGPTREEPGCIDYQLHRSTTDAGLWVLHESWRSQADLDLHFQKPAVAALLDHFPMLLRQAPELHYMVKVNPSATV